jgi:NAD+ synthase (glutamine-hydrolysing)
MDFTLALAQIDPALGDLTKNVTKHLAMAERARASGADLIVFPELSLTGYSIKDLNWDLALNMERDLSPVQPLLEASHSIPIIAGGVEEDPAFGIYNAAFYFRNGVVSSVHRKIYPPTYGMFEEMRYFSRGGSVRAFDTAWGRIGVLICEDLWHLSLPYVLALDGAHLLVALAASPTRVSSNEEQLHTASVNMEHHKAYARLLSSYVAFCNRVGFEDGVGFWGGSSLVGPDGSVDAQAKLLEEDLVFAGIHEQEVRRARRFSRHFLDEDPNLVAAELERIRRRGRE